MAIAVRRTKDLSRHGVKALIYGASGAGKTTSLASVEGVIVLSSEGGLLSVQDADLPYVEVTDLATLQEAYAWLAGSDEAKQYNAVALDSISEIGEVVLNAEKKQTKDPRQAYGALAEQMGDLVRAFRDLPGKHVIMTAKLDKVQDEQGRILYSPGMPGKSVGASLPYFFDEVFALRSERAQDGTVTRSFLTSTDGLWVAKDRSGKLDAWEAPDLGAIFAKIGGAA